MSYRFVRLITHTSLLITFCFPLLVACEPQATPFPVDVPPPPTTVETSAEPSQIRYALAANTSGLVADLDAIRAAAQVEQLTDTVNPADLGVRYDIVAAFGDLPGGTRSPITPHIALVVNPTLSPLDDPALLSIVQRSIDAQAIVDEMEIAGAQAVVALETSAPSALRAELANAGWPDGFDLTLAYAYTPGAAQLVGQLQAIGITPRLLLMTEEEVQAAFASHQLHLALISWTTPEQRQTWTTRFGDTNVIDLYTIPISYIAVPGLAVTYTVNGWPLPSPTA